ncbi:MAG: hypothetical protein ACI8QS_000194 [Planctomycetota bacterium]|jgi:hypothetical protein
MPIQGSIPGYLHSVDRFSQGPKAPQGDFLSSSVPFFEEKDRGNPGFCVLKMEALFPIGGLARDGTLSPLGRASFSLGNRPRGNQREIGPCPSLLGHGTPFCLGGPRGGLTRQKGVDSYGVRFADPGRLAAAQGGLAWGDLGA